MNPSDDRAEPLFGDDREPFRVFCFARHRGDGDPIEDVLAIEADKEVSGDEAILGLDSMPKEDSI